MKTSEVKNNSRCGILYILFTLFKITVSTCWRGVRRFLVNVKFRQRGRIGCRVAKQQGICLDYLFFTVRWRLILYYSLRLDEQYSSESRKAGASTGQAEHRKVPNILQIIPNCNIYVTNFNRAFPNSCKVCHIIPR